MNIVYEINKYKQLGINFELINGSNLKIDASREVLTDELIEKIKNQKEDILLFLEKMNNQFSLASTEINVCSRQNNYSLSNAQRRLWVLDQLDEESITYNMPSASILEGEIVTDALQKSYLCMLERHESLRTVFVLENGEPRQKILDEPEYGIEIIDLANSIDKENEARKLAGIELLTPFNLETGPLVRITIIRIEDEKHLLLFNMHHIISDGWSLGIFIKEFLYSYNCYRSGNKPDLKPLRIQYKDYSEWQNNLLESDAINSQREYWLEKLSGEIPVLDLPSDTIRPSVQTFSGSSRSFSLSMEVYRNLNNLCRENNISLFMMVQSLVKILLYRYTDQNDLILGSPVAGRVHEDLEDQIGLYVNTLVFRDTIESDSFFKEVLESVRNTCTEAFANQDYPFDRLIDDLDIKRDLSRSPLFDVMVILQNNESGGSVEFDGLQLSSYTNENVVSKFDMTFNFIESQESLICKIEYNTDIYSDDRILRMIEHLKTLTSSVIENPGSKVKDLVIIPTEEKNLLLKVFNDTRFDYPVDKTIIDLFEKQVENTPDSIAVVFEDIELSYRELNEKANILGHFLRDNYGIKPNDFIGVLQGRSEKMIISLLGVLKSGAAYIPIDPDYPEERIDYMLKDSIPKIVISDNNKGSFIDINEVLETGENNRNPEKKSNPLDLAYVIYTSGSTGKPKGTLIDNRAVVNYIKGITDKIDFRADKTIVSVTTFAFDIFVTESFLPLSLGQKIILANDEQQRDPSLLKELIGKNKVDMIQSTPSRIKLLISEESISNVLVELSEIMVGGEPFSEDLLEVLNSNYNGKIYNMYGPTETTVWSTFSLLSGGESVNIGKPIVNTQIYILDNNNNIVPVGNSGELHISGKGLSTGYLNRPELTSEKFVPNPFIPGEKMYKTGDLARWLPDGNIEFLGRMDNQVKIRGFRIETGEIENSLVHHKNIDLSLVLAKENTDGDKHLVAYYISDEEQELSDLRNFLGKSLPEYMIPSYFIHIEEFPLTPNGKIDMKALPEPDGSLKIGVEYIAPRDDIEEKMVSIWQEILGIEKIGILDNFFELGGHSLKATRVVSRISREFEVNLSLKNIFANPTIESISVLISQSNRKVYKLIEKVAMQGSYSLSNAQRRLWILDQLDDVNAAYSIPTAYYLEGELNTDAFQKAYSFIVERHESLRTVFISENGEPRQKILENPDNNIDIHDLRDDPENGEKAIEIVEKDFSIPFDLEKGPLIRFSIIRIEEEKNLLIFNIHHIISDGWSMGIFIKEFLSAYNSFRRNRIPDPEPLRIHYKDYSAWQNTLIASSEMDNQRDFWLKKLGGEIPILDLPADYVRPAQQTFNGNSYEFSLAKEINFQLNNLCKENQISFFMLLQALIKILFHRYTGKEDIILGSPVAGRVHEDLEDQIGLYLNTLAFRDTIESVSTFRAILDSVRKTCTDAFDNQDYPFDRLVDDLDLRRDLSRSPLFDFMVVLQNNESNKSEFDGLKVSPYIRDKQTSKFDMIINFSENETGLFCDIEYNTDIYSEGRITRMSEHFRTLVSSALENPDAKVRDLQIIPKDERTLLLDVFNDTKVDFPADRTIVDLFEERVEKSPDNIALVFEDVELTYRELNERANIVAHYLKENHDIEPEDMVGVLLDRSEKIIIALLGILKSGAVYVPIDPDYPEERIHYMLDDSDPKVLFGEGAKRSVNNRNITDMDMVLDSDQSTENLRSIISPENLAYIIYTSGSTGKPKGTLIEHRGFINMSLSQIKGFGIRDNDRILQFASTSFDASLSEVFMTLFSGSILHMVSRELKKDIDGLQKYIHENSISVATFPPALIKTFDKEILSGLRVLITAGEKPCVSNLDYYAGRLNYYNAYGPTETSVCASYYPIEAQAGNSVIPIGKPIANTRVYIVDRNRGLLPMGTPGELCVSGIGLARGYLNRPELTADKFVDNPFMNGERMYRTGDLARWLPSGDIEFLGRMDNQVKIRGFRIELGEIESVLLGHEKINSSIVMAKEDDNDRYLVAFYISDKELESSELKSFLGRSLPDYMVPSYFIHLEMFPLTSNGKIDRKALPDMDGKINSGIEYAPPRNEIEEKLVGIWENILGIERVGIRDDFFELGGHSLNATRVVSHINKKLGYKIALKDIFDNPNPTVESLAVIISQSCKKEFNQIESVKVQHSYELSSAQKRLWVLNQLDLESTAYNMPGIFILEGEFYEEAFNEAFKYIVNRHESLRTIFIQENGEPRQKIQDFNNNVELIDIRDCNDYENKIEESIKNEISNPFNLAEGPLVRFKVIRIKDGKYILLFNMHHIISDGWSMTVFTREFLGAYNSYREDQTPDLIPLRIQYKDYSAWQNHLLGSDSMANQKKFWLNKMGGELPVLDLPSDFIRPAVKTFNGNRLIFSVSKNNCVQLSNLSKKNHASLFMILQAIIKVLFYRYTGQGDIILGSPIAGRNHNDLEDQIGFYLNTLTFRDKINGENSFTEILKCIKKTCTEAFDNQDYPFDRLVEDLDIKRDLSRSPLFDVLLVLQNNETTDIEFDGLSVSPFETERLLSKFDMTFNFAESGEGLVCGIEYNTDIYSRDRIERIALHFKTLISSVISNPQTRIRDLEIIPEREKHILLNVFNDTKIDYEADKTIIDLFEGQVDKTPGNIAVVFDEMEMTYRELNENANIVGHYLRDNHSIKPDDLVAVMLDRSDKMIIVLLGILKSGAAYIPIDMDYPADRKKYMLEDSSPGILISDNKKNNVFDIENLNIDDILEMGERRENPKHLVINKNLAYVIYTSGSTGKPKGTLVNHRGLFNYLSWMKNTYGEKTGNWPLVTSYAFDLCVTGLFTPLFSGNSLYIYKSDLDVSEILTKCFNDPKVDSIKLTPSHISILENLDIVTTQINYVFTGGEKLKVENIRTLRRLNPSMEIINHYGPTESTVGCITNRICKESESVELGKPISNTQIYILDERFCLLPVGTPGELCISGSGLARGYLNRLELTNEKFLDNPFLTGERMYRTGDLARWRIDGSIEFLGRIDTQVKIRGFRIELAEIENLLLLQEDIESTVAQAIEGDDGQNQLVAYYVSEKEIEITVLRGILGRELPDYMIPTYFIHMETFPLTPNGKIDRNALPEPDGSISTGVEFIAPRNENEEILSGIWQDILCVEKIGIMDNFFELGGHSLKATRMVSRISKELEVDISLKDIFSNPTIETLSNKINISSKKEFIQIEPVSIQESYEVSNAQRRLWVLDQLEENSVAYNMPGAYILEGEFHEVFFQETFSFIVERHESLRTVFIAENGEPRQKIIDNPDSCMEIVDLRNNLDKRVKAENLAEQFLLTSFNLQQGPLIRFTILRLEDEKQLLLFNMHHIISDGWSMTIFTSEFLGVYNRIREGNPPDLAPLRIQYKDFSAWQNNLLESTIMDGQRSYWLDKLGGELPILDLPSDCIRPVMQTFNGDLIGFSLSGEISLNLTDFCNGNHISLFILLQALVKVLFHRYTGQTDIIIGSPVAGRMHKDLENQIGLYINTLVFRDLFSGDSTFLELLDSIKTTCLEAFDNQDYPFDRLVEELDIKRDFSRSPLFDVMLILQNNEEVSGDFDGLEVSPFKTEHTASKFDMTFNFVETGNGIHCGIEYNTDIYSVERIKRLAEHFRTLVQSVLQNPESRIKDLEILPVAEKNQILNKFNDTITGYPEDKTIAQLFEEQVERTPENIALVFEDTELSYRELNDKSNKVAHYLINNYGIKPDDLIGIMLNRSEKIVIALLGILKSGAAYIPIDPEYPESRIDFILDDSGPRLVLGNVDNNLQVNFERILEEDLGINNPETLSTPDSLAYVIYTSGSTGKPKGTLIKNRSVNNLIKGVSDVIDFNRGKSLLSVTSFSFDIFVLESILPLTKGVKVVIANSSQQKDPAALNQLMEKNRIDMFQTTPSRLKMFTSDNSFLSSFSGLSDLIVGGETFPDELYKTIKKHTEGKIYNMYGPTETTVWSTIKLLDKNVVNIGKPIANTGIYILDSTSKVVPVGIKGELCISGAGLALGYLNKPELTKEKFSEHPYLPNERLYRTGDYAIWLPDGNIDFLGRMDNQVKIRGFRIEPGEIESELGKHGDIRDVIVIAQEDKNNEKSLCGYYISDKELIHSEVREFLSTKLPQYMVPAFFVKLDSIPLTPNGKIDYKNLPEPEYQITVDFVPPGTEMERKIAEMLSDILDIEEISINSDLFEMGLNSISSIRFLGKLNEELGLNLSVTTIFLNPTIKEIAEEIKESSMLCGLKHIVKLTKGKKDKNLFIVGGDGTVYMFKQLAEYLGEEYNVYGIQATGITSDGKLPKTRKSLIKPYLKEMMTVQKNGPFTLIGYCYGAKISYSLAHMLKKKKKKVKKIIFLDVPPFIGEFTCEHMLLKNLFVHIINDIIHRFSRENRDMLFKMIEDIEKAKYRDYEDKIRNDETYRRMIDVKKNFWALFSNNMQHTRVVDIPLTFLVARFSFLTKGKLWMEDHYKKMSKSDDVKLLRIEGGHESLLFDPAIKDTSEIILDDLRDLEE